MSEANTVAETAREEPIVQNFDVDTLRSQYRNTAHTAFFAIEDFLRPSFAEEVAESYPSFSEAIAQGGKEFRRVNEDVKVQLTRAEEFPDPVKRLHRLLSSDLFLDQLSRITDIPDLVADPLLWGGGMHLMGRSGNLGVHVDFNFRAEAQLFRRLNLLLYLTPGWQEEWGGEFEFWDKDARQLLAAFAPRFNRCLLFNTTAESFHGVRAIRCPDGVTRNAFAVYYYTTAPPPAWNGKHHGTIYRARPDEWSKRFVQMPLSNMRRGAQRGMRFVRTLKDRLVGRDVA